MKTDRELNWPGDFAKLIGDMCCQSLRYKKEMKIEGVLAVTLDGGDVLIVNVNKQHKGSNDEFIIPKFTTKEEESQDMIQPFLSKLLGHMQPAQVSVTGLGTSKLVGELVITNSNIAGKMPQAKLILNEQQLPLAPSTSAKMEEPAIEKKFMSESNSPLHVSSTESTQQKDNNFILDKKKESVTTAGNLNNSSSSSGLTAKNLPVTSTAASAATKKSLDSVIAKLYHQTSGTGTVQVHEKGSPEEPQKASGKQKQATIVRGTLPKGHSPKPELSDPTRKVHGSEEMEIDNSEVMITGGKPLSALRLQGNGGKKESLASTAQASAEKISRDFVQKLFTESAVKTTKKLSVKSPSETIPISIVKPVTDESCTPPLKRQRVESTRYTLFKESLKLFNKDTSKPAMNETEKIVSAKYVPKSAIKGTIFDLTKSDVQRLSPESSKERATGSLIEVSSDTGSTRSTPTRESARIQHRQSTSGANSPTNTSTSGFQREKTLGNQSNKATPTVSRTSKNGVQNGAVVTPDVSKTKKESTPGMASKRRKVAQESTTTTTDKLNQADKQNLDESFQTLRTRTKKSNQEVSSSAALTTKIKQLDQEKYKKGKTIEKDGVSGKKRGRPFKKVEEDKGQKKFAKNVSTKDVVTRTRKNKYKVISSKVGGAKKKGTVQAQAQKIVKNIRTKQQARQKEQSSKNKNNGTQEEAGKKELKKSKRMCLKCEACLQTEDCGTCLFCLDKVKFGGANTLRQKCVRKQCKIFGLSVKN